MNERTWIKDTVAHVGEEVTLCGWVHIRRDMGKLIFLDVRDMTGIVQAVCLPGNAAVKEVASTLRPEYVVQLRGKVNARPEKQVKKEMPTGTVEIEVLELEVVSEAQTPPFEVNTDTSAVNEELRLQYRYLDLRSERLHRNVEMRSRFIQLCREYLFSQQFTEIETPLLTKSTPEGSRDFLVPSRNHHGSFYALPQSPQQYKQLLVGAGYERYFQLARAIRDEDLRADRGYEFSQIDIEMAFVTRDQVLETIEAMMIAAVEKMGFVIKQKPFPRITYADAMKQYGADKFDMRTEEEKKQGVLAYAWVVDFPFFERTDKGGWTFTHNPFSMPKEEHLEWLMAGGHIEDIITQQYDLVCNGYESAGGSIRAHKPEILRATYKVMGYTDEQIEESIGHMLKAFSYGFPPHGGIALGVERNIMNLTGETYLREVQAFPMSTHGRTAVMDAPSPVSNDQLDELGLQLKK